MTVEEAEEILGTNNKFFPYSKFYLTSLYNQKLRDVTVGNLVDINKVKDIKRAYNVLLNEIMYVLNDEGYQHYKAKFNYNDEKLIADYILGIENEKIPDYLKDEAESYYFALCILIPEESFRKSVNFYGGLKNVLEDRWLQERIADDFRVSVNKICIRLAEMYLFEAKDGIQTRIRENKIKRMRRNDKLY